LRAQGCDVVRVVDITPSAADPDVVREATVGQRIVLTADYDFGGLRFRDGLPALGIVQHAHGRLRTPLHGPIVHAALVSHRAELIDAFEAIEPSRTRVRSLDSSAS
jgi:predicted nuclease of predicted toxin-antitoxin system